MRQARNTEPPSGHRHSSLSALAVIASAVAIAACGSSSASHSAGGSSAAAQELKFTDCMRSHGVPNLPDSSVAGILIPIGSTINPQSPAFKSALRACAKLLPGGGPGGTHPSAQRKAQALQLSECMRRHGVSGFPDPTFSRPSNPAASQAHGSDGVFLAIPNTINTGSPVFKQAAAACRFTY